MLKPVCTALLLSACGTCLAVEPPIPLPPETSLVEPLGSGDRPALPVESRPAADSAVPPVPSVSAIPVPAAELELHPDPRFWYPGYRPEAVVPATNEGLHLRYPYYSYRRPWYPAGPASVNVTIVW